MAYFLMLQDYEHLEISMFLYHNRHEPKMIRIFFQCDFLNHCTYYKTAYIQVYSNNLNWEEINVEDQPFSNMNIDKDFQNAMASQCNMSSPPKSMAAMPARRAYPEVFYKVQPYIMMVCDEMDANDSAMPTQETIDNISDSIYDDVCRMYPDIAEYARGFDNLKMDPPIERGEFGREPEMFNRRFRRRGLFRDFIDFLLLQELFRRRRRFPFGFIGF